MWPSSRQPSAKVNRIELWVRLYAAIVYTHHHHLFTTQLILIYPRRVEGRVNTAERVCSTSPRLCKAMALVINTTATATVGYYLQTSRPAVRHVTSRRHPLVVPLSVAASSCLYGAVHLGTFTATSTACAPSGQINRRAALDTHTRLGAAVGEIKQTSKTNSALHCSICTAMVQYILCLKKGCHFWCLIITLANVDRFTKFFHQSIREKILYVYTQGLPSHLQYVATLPCESRKSKTFLPNFHAEPDNWYV